MAQTVHKPCPICGKCSTDKYWPFCSKRCGDIDLSRWFNESYSVPTDDVAEEERSEDC